MKMRKKFLPSIKTKKCKKMYKNLKNQPTNNNKPKKISSPKKFQIPKTFHKQKLQK